MDKLNPLRVAKACIAKRDTQYNMILNSKGRSGDSCRVYPCCTDSGDDAETCDSDGDTMNSTDESLADASHKTRRRNSAFLAGGLETPQAKHKETVALPKDYPEVNLIMICLRIWIASQNYTDARMTHRLFEVSNTLKSGFCLELADHLYLCTNGCIKW